MMPPLVVVLLSVAKNSSGILNVCIVIVSIDDVVSVFSNYIDSSMRLKSMCAS